MFIDEANITIKAGNGGNGSSSFRREKFVPEGGPDGGNGGDGGNVIFKGDKNINTLTTFKYQKHFFADNGVSGSSKNRHGANGEDLILTVPLGTQIIDYETENVIYDITEHDEIFCLAKGGRGGRGNATFKTSVNRAPRQTTPGEETQPGKFTLRLKLFCDIGIVGFPNAGKSTLINTITNTKSIVADYPFTTIKPVLGVIEIHYKQYVLCDIPGLIEGASENIGLGHKFLKHIERCKAIIHLIDINADDLIGNYNIIRSELKKYNQLLSKKKELIVFSQSDRLTKKELEEKIKIIKNDFKKKKFIIISSSAREGIDDLIKEIPNLVVEK